MPMGDGRCSLCGYWHAPGSEHIGRRPSYGICARCGNFHTEGPCPQLEEPMRFPSRAEREAIGRRFEVRASAELHEMQQSEDRARAVIRKVMIERVVRELTWPGLRADLVNENPLNPSFICMGFAELVRARFRELAG